MTLFLLTSKKQITEKEILETFKEAGVIKAFEKLADEEQKKLFKIASSNSEDKQVKMILKFIDQLSKSND